MIIQKVKVKGNNKKYKRKKDKDEVIITNKYINLGVNSNFAVDDSVIVISEKDYDTLNGEIISNNNDENINEEINNINDLLNVIDNLNNIINSKDNEINKLQADIDKSEQFIKTTSDKIDKQKNKYESMINDLNNSILDKDNVIINLENKLNSFNNVNIDELENKNKELESLKYYYILLQKKELEYKTLVNYLNKHLLLDSNRNIFQRIINKDVSSDIDKPQLNLINFDGNDLNKNNDDLINTIVKNSGK